MNAYYFKNKDFSPVYSFFCYYDHASVIIFFVLSGYLIFYASEKYEKGNANSLKKYFIDRFSRIYSVLIPAILLTMLLDLTGRLWFKDIYLANVPNDNYLFRLIWNMFSMQGTWGPRIQFAGNAALWSVGYEFSFYLIFAVYVYMKRDFLQSKVALAIIVGFFLLKGPKISMYFFIWLFGCIAFLLSNKYKFKVKPGYFLVLFLMLFVLKNFIYRADVLYNNEYLQDLVYGIFFSSLLLVDFSSPSGPSPVFVRGKKIIV